MPTEANREQFLWTDHGFMDAGVWDFDCNINCIKRAVLVYEHRGHYKHTYAVVQTKEGKWYVTEKNTLGVVWQRARHSTKEKPSNFCEKIEHDGSSWGRIRANIFQEWIADKNSK